MADEISGLANTVYADGPAGTPTQPPKPDIRTLFGVVQAQVDSAKSLAATQTQWKSPVAIATTANITLSGEQTIDGVLTSASDVLVKNQTLGAANGIYTTAAGAWSRRADSNESAEVLGMAVFVRLGTANAGKQFICSTPSPIVLGTTVLTFAELSDQSALNASLADKADQTDLDAAEAEIALKADQVQVDEIAGSPLLHDEFADGWAAEDGTFLGGFRHDGTVEWNDTYTLLDPEFSYAFVDVDGYVIFGVRHDGTFYPSGSQESETDILAMVNGGQIIVQRDGVRAPITFANVQDRPEVSGDFVSYISDDGTILSTMTEEVKALMSISGTQTAVVHFLLYGQSLSEGARGTPSTHTTAVRTGRALMFNAGVRTRGGGDPSLIVPPENTYSIVDLLEVDQEGPGTGIGWGVTDTGRLPSTTAALVSAHGWGGRTYAELKKGTNPYTNLLNGVRRGRVMASLNDIDYALGGTSFIHGEADRVESKATYLSYLEELQSDLTADLNALTGETGEALIAVCQFSSFTKYSMTSSDVPFAQLQAAIDNPGKIICVGPKYFLPYYTDGIHLTAASYARLGSYHARALDVGPTWEPLYCTGASRIGAVITLAMNVPVGPLVLDTTAVTNPGNYGFTWSQTGGTTRTISSVAILGSSIVITLSGDPGAPSASSIGIAASGTSGADAGPTAGARCCLRDSAADLDIDGAAMPNWACQQLVAL